MARGGRIVPPAAAIIRVAQNGRAVGKSFAGIGSKRHWTGSLASLRARGLRVGLVVNQRPTGSRAAIAGVFEGDWRGVGFMGRWQRPGHVSRGGTFVAAAIRRPSTCPTAPCRERGRGRVSPRWPSGDLMDRRELSVAAWARPFLLQTVPPGQLCRSGRPARNPAPHGPSCIHEPN